MDFHSDYNLDLSFPKGFVHNKVGKGNGTGLDENLRFS